MVLTREGMWSSEHFSSIANQTLHFRVGTQHGGTWGRERPHVQEQGFRSTYTIGYFEVGQTTNKWLMDS